MDPVSVHWFRIALQILTSLILYILRPCRLHYGFVLTVNSRLSVPPGSWISTDFNIVGFPDSTLRVTANGKYNWNWKRNPKSNIPSTSLINGPSNHSAPNSSKDVISNETSFSDQNLKLMAKRKMSEVKVTTYHWPCMGRNSNALFNIKAQKIKNNTITRTNIFDEPRISTRNSLGRDVALQDMHCCFLTVFQKYFIGFCLQFCCQKAQNLQTIKKYIILMYGVRISYKI